MLSTLDWEFGDMSLCEDATQRNFMDCRSLDHFNQQVLSASHRLFGYPGPETCYEEGHREIKQREKL